MSQPLVTAIITTYKREPQILKRAVNSVLQQTYKNIELIVVDDSPSNYEHREKVKSSVIELDSNIKYISHKTNKGACAARNTGIKAAKGEYIAFLDDDDEWLPTKTEKQIKLFHDDEIALVYCESYSMSSGNAVKKKNIFNAGMVYEKLILKNFIGSTSFAMIRKSVLDELNGFDEKMESAQDYELWLRISKKYKVDYVDEPLVNYYIHEGEQISKNPKKKLNGLVRLNELNIDYLRKHRKVYSIRVLKIVPFEWKINKTKAIRKLLYSLYLHPFNFKLTFRTIREMLK